jgi:hypothetical protein
MMMLKVLFCGWIGINFVVLCRVLRDCSSIRTINVSHNRLTSKAAGVFAQLIKGSLWVLFDVTVQHQCLMRHVAVWQHSLRDRCPDLAAQPGCCC